MIGQVWASTDQRLVAGRVKWADSWLGRLVGLLGAKSIADDQAVWLRPCGSIHTVGMRFAIDVVFLSRQNRVIAIVPNVRPYRICIAQSGTYSVLELAAGRAAQIGLTPGEDLVFEQGKNARPH